ncbi:hypothetical protein JEQ12_004754, partial [Ovis aries]
LGVPFRSHPEVVAVCDIRVFITAPLYKGNERAGPTLTPRSNHSVRQQTQSGDAVLETMTHGILRPRSWRPPGDRKRQSRETAGPPQIPAPPGVL